MAAAHTTVATTVEGQLLELISVLQSLERNAVKNPNGLNKITGAYNQDAKTFSGTYNLDVTETLNNTGDIVLAAVEYLT